MLQLPYITVSISIDTIVVTQWSETMAIYTKRIEWSSYITSSMPQNSVLTPEFTQPRQLKIVAVFAL